MAKQQRLSMTSEQAKRLGITWDAATIRRMRAERDAPQKAQAEAEAAARAFAEWGTDPNAQPVLVSDGRRVVFTQARRPRVDEESVERLDAMFGAQYPWGVGWGRF